MAYDIFSRYGLNKIEDTEDGDVKLNNADQWKLVKSKEVLDSDGFLTEYTWYTNGDKHIFMFGDSEIYEPDEDYADWEAETDEEAAEWFDNYTGFDSEFEDEFEEDVTDDQYTGHADFMNEGFNRVFGEGKLLED